MAFEGLTEKLSAAFKKLRGKGRLSEADVKEAMKEIRMALLEADVNFKVVKQFVATVTERAIGADVLESLTPAQMIVKIVNEELTNLMGGESTKLTISPKPPTVVMLVGLNGAGKTTNGAKLAGFMKKQGKRPLLVACDTFRPAAITQLEVVGQQVDVPVFQMGQIDPVDIARAGIEHAKQHGNDIVFIDTAGRLHVDEELMEQLKVMKAAIDPTEILLIVDAMIGQDAVNAAKAFDEALDITGVMLTKLDGDARGGAALSIKAVTGKPIKFVARARSWTRWTSSTPTAWPPASWAWAMCSPSSRRPSRALTPRKPPSWSRSSGRINSPWPTFTTSWCRSRAWAPWPTSPGCSPAWTPRPWTGPMWTRRPSPAPRPSSCP